MEGGGWWVEERVCDIWKMNTIDVYCSYFCSITSDDFNSIHYFLAHSSIFTRKAMVLFTIRIAKAFIPQWCHLNFILFHLLIYLLIVYATHLTIRQLWAACCPQPLTFLDYICLDVILLPSYLCPWIGSVWIKCIKCNPMN